MERSMIALLVCLLCSNIVTGNTDDWPMFQHDPQHSGYSSSPMPESLKEVWANESYCGSSGGEVTGLAISGDSVYVTHFACFSALDIRSGSVIWSDHGVYILSNFPAISNDRLFISHSALIRCFDAETGEELWKLTEGLLDFTSSPIAIENYVIVGGGYPLHVFPSTPESRRAEARAREYARRVMCLDSGTGRIMWEFYLNDYADSSPAYFDGRVYVNDGSSHVYCLDVQTGALIWKRETEWNSSSSLSLDGERIFAGTSMGIICLKLETGEILWRFESDNKISHTPAVAYERVFAGDRDGVLYCLNAETGKLIWKMETKSIISSSIIVADKKVAFGTGDGKLYIIKIGSGKICESLDLGDSEITAFALSDGKLFVGQENGRISCFEGSAHISLTPFVIIFVIIVLLVLINIWYRKKT